MHIICIRHPTVGGKSFNLAYYLSVHLPMGLSRFRAINGTLPQRVIVQHSTRGLDGKAESADSYATSWLCFETQNQADGFVKLFQDAAASRALIDDMPNYAPTAPTFLMAEMIEMEDIAALAGAGDLKAHETAVSL